MFYLINDIDLGEFDVSKAQSITTKDGARFNTSWKTWLCEGYYNMCSGNTVRLQMMAAWI